MRAVRAARYRFEPSKLFMILDDPPLLGVAIYGARFTG
jgi:hypothetical protein